jgi:hypothetical protein
MGGVLFFFSCIAVGTMAGKTLIEHYETLPSEQIGATGFMFLLCLLAAMMPTACGLSAHM